MPLSSPRFKDEPALQAVDSGSRTLRDGVTGRHVHLVQMALIDLGFSMPRSTTSTHFSPDGIYGRETSDVVKAFQRSNPPLTVDGEIGPQTMRALDARFPSFTHRVNLHFRSLSLSDVPFSRMMSSIERVYAQYSIDARFASGSRWHSRKTSRAASRSSTRIATGTWKAASSRSSSRWAQGSRRTTSRFISSTGSRKGTCSVAAATPWPGRRARSPMIAAAGTPRTRSVTSF